MDGTLVSNRLDGMDKYPHMTLNEVDSTPGVIGAWESFAESYPGLNIPEILSRMTPLHPHYRVTKALHSLHRGTWSPNR
jgi:hypothetical protein